MLTPYDWQEGIGNRASYIEGKLEHGTPVLAVSLAEGILVYTRKRQARKIYEIYDRLIFGAVGQQSDVEALRTAAVEFAHQEGYNRSEKDVTIQRVVTALSGPVKKAFADFSSAPLVARSLFAEVNERPEDDLFYTLEFDGDYSQLRNVAAVAGTHESMEALTGKLESIDRSLSADQARERLEAIWQESVADLDQETLGSLQPEAVLLERSGVREDRFRVLV